ncbi:MAG TPA: HEAT repeat domain-containing protein [Verrucomicrobiae bacterium]|nr:HEAT repeat domain-containing protein [Verrucomicrobiae bacterium]
MVTRSQVAVIALLTGACLPLQADAGDIRPVFDEEVARFSSLARGPRAELRAEAAEGFGLMRHHAGEESLLPLVRDSDADVRSVAIEALGHCGMRRGIAALAGVAATGSREERRLAHIALERMTGTSFPEDQPGAYAAWLAADGWDAKEDRLLAAIEGRDPGARMRALVALRFVGSGRAEDRLLARAGGQPRFNGEEFRHAVRALERIGSAKALPFLAGLATAFPDTAWALGQIGGPGADAALQHALARFGSRRVDATVNLDRLASTNCAVHIPMLIRSFGFAIFRSDTDELHRPPHAAQRAAANLILRSGESQRVVDLVLKEVEGTRKDEETPERWRGVLAAMREELKAGFWRNDGRTEADPLAALPHIIRDKAFVPRLRALLRHPAVIVRIYAAECLGALEANEAIPDMLAAIREPYPFADEVQQVSGKHREMSQGVRWKGYLCMALGRLGGEDARVALEVLAADPAVPRDVRFGAVTGLSFIGSKKSLPVLRKAAGTDIVWTIRGAAADAAREIEFREAADVAMAKHE